MKTLKIFSLILLVAALFTSCEKEDEGTPSQVTKTYEYSQILRGSKDINGTITDFPILTLANIIGEDAAKNFKSAEMQIASCYIEIDGLDQITAPSGVATLKDFTVQIGTHPAIVLGDCKVQPQLQNEFGSDVSQSTAKFINIVTNIFTDLTSGNKSAQIKVSFNPNVDIPASSNLRIKIVVSGTYHYVVFE
ncbi:MAG TPA: hypothetical protein DER09_06190 [Prolixibacteraceae bacterium]|nr:hypothetical protein [Prolixibacteraceae bacterium]